MIEVIKSFERERRLERLARIRERNVALDAELMAQVGAIIEEVRRRGDAALVEYTERFDGVRIRREDVRVSAEDVRASAARVSGEVLAALREAIKRIRAFHEHERAEDWRIEASPDGSMVGQRMTPIERAGLYVPGGTASYPSSVVMNVVPAQVAGVARIVVATPPRTLSENPAVAAALLELGVTEIYGIGGAQAIAALAYGTQTVPRVDKITGPGNRYVAAAKKLVFGAVGIDSIAGPSEVVILADETARAELVAADLLAQAEHGEDASAVLITTSLELAERVAAETERQARLLPRREMIAASLAAYGALIVVERMEEACALVDELAPEHLEIMARDEERVAARVHHAGAIFFGAYTPEAVGDYFAGPNHVLPTGGSARFSSALGVADFTRRTSLVRYTSGELARTSQLIAALARAEGLDAHARSATIRADYASELPSVNASDVQLGNDAGLQTGNDAGLKDTKLKDTGLQDAKLKDAKLKDAELKDAELKDAEPQSVSPQSEAPEAKPSVSGGLAVVKGEVRALRAYTLSPERGRIKINQNENPWDVPPRIRTETQRRLEARAWSRYPDFVPASLHERLARFADWTPDGVLAGNGSNELIQALLMVTVGAGRRVLISEPTFALYRQVTTVLGGQILSVPLKEDLSFDAGALLDAVTKHQPAVTIICSPNNPTGCRLAKADLSRLLDATPGLVAVDEAYWEFSGETARGLLAERENLVVFRTFSKALAMAALRVGYLLAAPALVREISKAVLPYNLNAMSQTAAEVAIELYDEELKPLVGRIVSERERLFGELQQLGGLEPVASEANFMVVRSSLEPRRVYRELLARGILIRDVSSYPMLKDYFRLSVGTPAENDAVVAALREVFEPK